MGIAGVTFIIALYLLFALGVAEIVWELPSQGKAYTRGDAVLVGTIWPLFLAVAGILVFASIVEQVANWLRRTEK